jgi:hypothetical protein
VAKSQIGFIDFVVCPYFEALSGLLPGMRFAVNQLKSNREVWGQEVDKYEKWKEENENQSIL